MTITLFETVKTAPYVQFANKTIDTSSDTSVAEEMARLREILKAAQNKRQELIDIITTVMTYTMKGVEDIFSIGNAADLLCGPSTLIRLWTANSRSPNSDDLGFRCSNWGIM
jgi:hypothetical protein